MPAYYSSAGEEKTHTVSCEYRQRENVCFLISYYRTMGFKNRPGAGIRIRTLRVLARVFRAHL